jgi:hypothetical protein
MNLGISLDGSFIYKPQFQALLIALIVLIITTGTMNSNGLSTSNPFIEKATDKSLTFEGVWRQCQY